MNNFSFSAQERLLPGKDLPAKYEFAQSIGITGIELQVEADRGFNARREELARAVASGVRFPSACLNTQVHIGSFDESDRNHAIDSIVSCLPVLCECGVDKLVVANACGQFSAFLPPFAPPVPVEESRKVLAEGLRKLLPRAADLGIRLCLEPLNRFEDHLLNTAEQTVHFIEEERLDGLRICLDTYHMSLEERNIAQAVATASPYLDHLHLGDSQRSEPGIGHYDWNQTFIALTDAGFVGPAVFECFLSGDPETSLTNSMRFLANTLRPLDNPSKEKEND